MRSGAIALFSVVKLIYISFKDRLAGDCSFELKKFLPNHWSYFYEWDSNPRLFFENLTGSQQRKTRLWHTLRNILAHRGEKTLISVQTPT